MRDQLKPVEGRTRHRRGRRRTAVLVSWAALVCFCGTPPVSGQPAGHSGRDLGNVSFVVSCSASAQARINRAVALLHHMTYPQARTEFQAAAREDPRCAMAHWGVAMTLFQPLWPTRPGPADLRAGRDAVRSAQRLGAPTERERLFIAAADSFFADPPSTDYWTRIRRWAEGQREVYRAAPDDDDAAAFYALAILALPAPGDSALFNSERAAALLLPIYDRNPEHPGAMHYLVHANDANGRERNSLEVTRRYEEVAPRNPHALHMPTHIYTRLGDWQAVINGNLLAAEAALQHPAGDRGQLVWDEFPHAIEYAVYAYLQRGDDSGAAAQIRRLRETVNLEPTFKTAFHLASTQARFLLERGAWAEATELAPREPSSLDWDRFAWPEGIVRFARGLGAVHEGRLDVAAAERERLTELEAHAQKGGEGLWATNIRILGLELEAYIAQASQDPTRAVELVQRAAGLEHSTPKHAVTPAPTLPADELLGDLRFRQRLYHQALAAYLESLERHPGRFNSLLGAARAAREAGRLDQARNHYGALLQAADPASGRPALSEARRFLAEAEGQRATNEYVTVGLFIGSIEEGARIFTPVRLLPREHPEALGHDFPTVLQFHGGEDRLLIMLGRAAGLQLGTTLQRYPTEPDTTWPYAPFLRPPAERFASVTPERRPSGATTLPGLHAVAFLDRFPLGFIVDTRGLSLAARNMTRATSSGLDITRAQLLDALSAAGRGGPSAGPWIVVFDPP